MEHEDKDEDGKVSWEEFSGPKGDAPPKLDSPADTKSDSKLAKSVLI